MLYGLYIVTLHKETHFHLNRFYLLFSYIISLLIPLINIPVNNADKEATFFAVLETVQITSQSAFAIEKYAFINHYVIVFYLIGMSVFLMRFISEIISLIFIHRQCSIEANNQLNIALSKKQIAPFSFFKTIYIDKKTINEESQEKIIMHETIHVRQWHTIDVVFAELICVLNWFNPFCWKMKVALKETHEYLADLGVSEQTPEYAEYFMLLFRNAIGVQPGFANNLNKSLTLKRLIMMKKTRSSKLSKMKVLLAFPIVIVLFIAFSCNKNADKLKSQYSSNVISEKKETVNNTSNNDSKLSAKSNDDKTFISIEKMPEYPNGYNALIDYLSKNIQYPEEAKEKGIEGKVFVNFTVTKTGKIKNVTIKEKGNSLFDAEAIRVVSKMPNWIPGLNKGTPVDVEMTLPIVFKLS
ncbi:MAG: hypothetical protein A2X12_05320 [Bacteroidetes bacterium GWE2_29_8]|nr:MAG: hypothetical protein A2X12_05320 [Bacteroidetes bacterium GWE2_29_8]OFY14777.1 MAG: hypothetical protein A2X02_04525 [Bacteroidetes bacterium GWF2_29_10]